MGCKLFRVLNELFELRLNAGGNDTWRRRHVTCAFSLQPGTLCVRMLWLACVFQGTAHVLVCIAIIRDALRTVFYF